jgi:hypothetical protein
MLQHLDDRLAALVFAEEAVVVDAVLGEQGREAAPSLAATAARSATAGPEIGHGASCLPAAALSRDRS